MSDLSVFLSIMAVFGLWEMRFGDEKLIIFLCLVNSNIGILRDMRNYFLSNILYEQPIYKEH